MTKQDLATELKKMYTSASQGDKTTMIRLFGIKYAQQLKECEASMTEIAELSEVGASYHAEISKGIRLAKYVKLK
ncbi:MAG: hypothetical protein PHW07_07025 [Sulfurospirillaceae bacterium]|nr:hypothetical protein [Sulfurospirillaceae bacterium]